MKTLETIKDELMDLVIFEDEDTIEDRVSEVLEKYSFEGVKDLVIEDTHSVKYIGEHGVCYVFVAYVNYKNAPVIEFMIKRNDNISEVVAVNI